MSLSERERRFVDAYMGEAAGNGTEAARLAGYKGKPKVLQVQASRLLSKAIVQSAMTERRTALESQSIADAKERRELLTIHARGENPVAAIKAIDTLNKMDALYVERHDVNMHVTLAQLLGATSSGVSA